MTLDPNSVLNNPQEIKTVPKEHNPDPALLEPEEEKVFKDVKFDDRCHANFSSRVDEREEHLSHRKYDGGKVPVTFPLINTSNQVDSWIDDLNELCPEPIRQRMPDDEATMTWLIQESLPRFEYFDGSPTQWVDVIIKFRDLVHQQTYLSFTQRSVYLLQQLRGEARRAVQGFGNDKSGYFKSLKRLKFMFGQKSRIAQVTLLKVPSGIQIANNDHKGLCKLYYTISNCLVTLRKLNYISDLYSSNVLRQATRRFPPRLYSKWSKQCLNIRRKGEPNLLYLEAWLQERILASNESYLPFNPDDERHNRSNLDHKRGKEVELRRERDAKDTKNKRDYLNGALKTEVSK